MTADILREAFMQRAALATFLAGLACSQVGVLVVTMRLSFLGVCMAHAAFAGALLGGLWSLPPLATALGVSLAAALLLGPLSDRAEFGPDTAMGIVFSGMLGVSFLLLALLPGPKAEALNLLWGSVLTVLDVHIVMLALVAFGVTALIILFFHEVRAVVFHRELALAAGIPATAALYAILGAAGFAVTASLHAVGGLLVFSLIVNPAAAAYQITWDLRRLFLLAAAFGVASGWGGLALSVAFNLPAGALIILVSTALFLAAAALSPKRRFRRAEEN